MNPTTDEIRSAPCPKCAVCGSKGNPLYHNLRDRLFTAPGEWNLGVCSNPSCRLIWPDPMPLTEDIGKAYTTYYTHASQHDTRRQGFRQKLSQSMLHSYWGKRYGYQFGPIPLLAKALSALSFLSPIRRREGDASVRCLPALPNGRLLDVGCGSGDWLMMMRELGWQVSGNDFDTNAVKVATQRGLDVFLGSVEQQALPDNSFDAVTLSHVIEHVPDPLATVRECLRILKPGGKIVLLTPNGESLSHRFFKADWRGLEPPRHLHIFSRGSMDQMLAQAGFKQRVVHPFIVTSVIYDSLQLRWGRNNASQESKCHRLAWLIARVFKLLQLCLIGWNPKVGDCLIAVAGKSP